MFSNEKTEPLKNLMVSQSMAMNLFILKDIGNLEDFSLEGMQLTNVGLVVTTNRY